MAKQILLKPIITEKAETISEDLNKFSFVVNKKANKIEIKKAVEKMYNVQVVAVNTMIIPGKVKSRSTRAGVLQGRVPAYKKAVVTLASGENIDFFGDL